VDLIVKQMKLTSLKAIAEGVEIEDLKKQPYTRATLTHYLPEYITDNLDSYFAEAKSSVIHEFLQVLDADPVSKNHEELVQQVIELINWTGVHAFLTRFDVSFLKEIMEDLDLDCGSDNKANIVMAIVNGTDAEPGKAVRKQVAPSKKKPKMKAGITKEDLQQYYYKDEMVAYCEEKGLIKSGKKSEIIKRIVAFHNGDKENTMAPANKTKASAEKSAKAEKPKKKESEPEQSEESGSDESEGEEEQPKKETTKKEKTKSKTSSPEVTKAEPEVEKVTNKLKDAKVTKNKSPKPEPESQKTKGKKGEKTPVEETASESEEDEKPTPKKTIKATVTEEEQK